MTRQASGCSWQWYRVMIRLALRFCSRGHHLTHLAGSDGIRARCCGVRLSSLPDNDLVTTSPVEVTCFKSAA